MGGYTDSYNQLFGRIRIPQPKKQHNTMKFKFNNLDAETRALMKEEIERAIQTNEIYSSTRFNAAGESNWIQWLIQAAEEHDAHWLAYQIEACAGMKDFEGRAKPSGGYTVAHVPHTAAETIAEGQFNRFYIAAVCLRAIGIDKKEVIVYRARQRGEPRPESRELEGASLNAQELLEQVRSKQQSFKCELLKPNSGLSVQI